MAKQLTLEQANEFAYIFYSDGGGNVSNIAAKYGRDDLIAFLNNNVEELCGEVAGMNAEQLAYKLAGAPSGPDESGDEEHFDTAQIMTHMASAIAFHWWNITRALRHERPPMPKPPEGVNVTGKKKNALGGGGWQGMTADELCKLLRDTAGGFTIYVKQLPGDTGGACSSFGLFRDMTPHDWLFVVAVHAATHLVQIREMKAQPDFPR